MSTSDIKSELIHLLKNDPDIQHLIKNITINNELTNPSPQTNRLKALEEENQTLKNQNTQLTTSLSTLEKELTTKETMLAKIKKLLGCAEENNKALNDTIFSLQEQIKQERQLQSECENKLKKYNALFAEEMAAYDRFQALSNTTKISLKGIFKDDSIAGFIACGVQEKHIDSLWEYIKNEVMEDHKTDLDNLLYIFDFLFMRFTLASPIYERQQVKPQDEFDPKQHIKHSRCNNVSGEIQAIVFSGWINNKTNKIIKQSIVTI